MDFLLHKLLINSLPLAINACRNGVIVFFCCSLSIHTHAETEEVQHDKIEVVGGPFNFFKSLISIFAKAIIKDKHSNGSNV